jgi:hypothetical protein
LVTLRDQLADLSADPLCELLRSEVDRWVVREGEASFPSAQAATGTLNLPD